MRKSILISALLLMSMSQMAITRIVGIGADNTPSPAAAVAAGTCSVFQLVRDSGAQINAGLINPDLDLDAINKIVYATTDVAPLNGGLPAINNLYKISASGALSISAQTSVVIRPNAAGGCDDFITNPFNFCVDATQVRVDVANNFVYVAGAQIFAGAHKSVGVVDATSLNVGSITTTYNNGGGSIVDVSIAFDNTLTWFGIAAVRPGDIPNTLMTYRLNRDSIGSGVQGPINQAMTGNSANVQRGNMVVDTTNSFIYVLENTNSTPALKLRAYDFTLTDKGSHSIDGDLTTPGSTAGSTIVWNNAKNELIVCTTNYLAVYSGFPFTLIRSVAVGCSGPAYDSVNNKLYVIRTGQLARVNYATLVQEGSQAFAGLSNYRMVMDATKQFVYGVENGGPLGGSAIAKYNVCANPTT